jgi:glycosyltransferase involved in cell wall biosynthesis
VKILENNPMNIQKAELIVGMPSLNEAGTIANVAAQAAIALSEHFSEYSSVIINCDNNSTDGTREAFMNAETGAIPRIYITTPEGIKGKGNNIRNLFKKALTLDAKAIVIIDSDLRNISPLWIKKLFEPLLKGFEYVTSLYMRHKHDDLLCSLLAYPFTRCLYGRRVKQPMGGEFGLSTAMVKEALKSPLWNEDVSQFGIDLWMTTTAINAGMQICQVYLGAPKLHHARDYIMEINPLFRQAVSTLYSMMDPFGKGWSMTKWSKPTAIFGFDEGEILMPPEIMVSREKLYYRFKSGFSDNWDAYRAVLSGENFQKLREIASLEMDSFEMPSNLWARILFDFAIWFNQKTCDRLKAMEFLFKMYQGMVLSYVNKVTSMSNLQSQEIVEEICLQLEQTKPYLVDRWKK